MNIDPKSTIAGLPAMDARALLRGVKDHQFTVKSLSTFLARSRNLPIEDAVSVIMRLQALGFIEARGGDDLGDALYWNTIKGNALCLASAAKPIKRSTADKALSEFLARVETVNASDEYSLRVDRVFVFGSYLSEKERLSDIDLGIEVSPKWDNPEEQEAREEAIRAEAEKGGKYFPSFLARLTFPEGLVFKFLKSRSRSISLTQLPDSVLENGPSRCVYRRLTCNG